MGLFSRNLSKIHGSRQESCPRLFRRCGYLLGHALGIWGHSSDSRDALYGAAVANPPAISPRDRNTLVKIYEQPTRLGWPLD